MADNLNKKDYQENVESLIDFSELTNKEENVSLFEGINLSNKRAEDESYEDYKSRLKLNKSLEKLYKRLGRQQCLELYPAGFKSAIDQVKKEQKQELKEEKDGSNS